MPAKNRALTLNPSQLRHVLNVTQATSRHSGRRSFASALIRKGVDLEQVAILLGHAEIDVTATYIGQQRSPTSIVRTSPMITRKYVITLCLTWLVNVLTMCLW